MKIITSGKKYIDIDALACIFAYKELLDLKNQDSKMVVTAELNSSVTDKYREINFDKDISDFDNLEFIIVDVSDPNYFEDFVDLDSISNIFDHHPGFERYWNEKIGTKSVIEPIGAAATLIFREYKKSGLLEKISSLSAELLAVAILSNTLNFQAKITKNEDKEAYEELKKFFKYTSDFEEKYFLEVQNSIEKDFLNSLKNDSKEVSQDLFIAQLEIWDSNKIINNFYDEIKNFLNSQKAKISFLNLIELGSGKNIIIPKNNETIEYLKNIFPEFDYSLKDKIITPHVILRKEIIRRIYEK